MKYSLIIPVYNVEKYVAKCLASIFNQSYNNYEVIIVDDGSLDNSAKIIKEFIKNKNKFKYYKKTNGGLSDARNYGVNYATGDYIIFIDSDDYIDNLLLEKLNNVLKNKKYDIVRYGLNVVDENDKKLYEVNNAINGNNLEDTIKSILKTGYLENSWLYAYNTDFWRKNNFKFSLNKIHEDFGLTPIILSKCKSIYCLDYKGYNYVIRKNSIMTQTNYEKLHKRVMDFKKQFEYHKKAILPKNKVNNLLLGYSAEAFINKCKELRDEDLKQEIAYLKSEKIVNQIYVYNFKKMLKKIYLQIFLVSYLNNISKKYHQNLERNANE